VTTWTRAPRAFAGVAFLVGPLRALARFVRSDASTRAAAFMVAGFESANRRHDLQSVVPDRPRRILQCRNEGVVIGGLRARSSSHAKRGP